MLLVKSITQLVIYWGALSGLYVEYYVGICYFPLVYIIEVGFGDY